MRYLVRISVGFLSILPDTCHCCISSIQILINSSTTVFPVLIRSHCSSKTVTKQSTKQSEFPVETKLFLKSDKGFDEMKLKQRSTNLGVASKSRLQKGDVKQIPYRQATNIRHHRANFSSPDDLAPRIWELRN